MPRRYGGVPEKGNQIRLQDLASLWNRKVVWQRCMSSSRTVDIARACAGVALGCFGFAVIPVFGMPFDGCEHGRWLVLSPACGHWPELLRGFLFVLPIALLVPARWMFPVVAILILLCFALVGGAAGFQTGEHIYPAGPRLQYFMAGYPLLLGGLVGSIPWIYLRAKPARRAA